jgi:hypothetical protein
MWNSSITPVSTSDSILEAREVRGSDFPDGAEQLRDALNHSGGFTASSVGSTLTITRGALAQTIELQAHQAVDDYGYLNVSTTGNASQRVIGVSDLKVVNSANTRYALTVGTQTVVWDRSGDHTLTQIRDGLRAQITALTGITATTPASHNFTATDDFAGILGNLKALIESGESDLTVSYDADRGLLLVTGKADNATFSIDDVQASRIEGVADNGSTAVRNSASGVGQQNQVVFTDFNPAAVFPGSLSVTLNGVTYKADGRTLQATGSPTLSTPALNTTPTAVTKPGISSSSGSTTLQFAGLTLLSGQTYRFDLTFPLGEGSTRLLYLAGDQSDASSLAASLRAQLEAEHDGGMGWLSFAVSGSGTQIVLATEGIDADDIVFERKIIVVDLLASILHDPVDVLDVVDDVQKNLEKKIFRNELERVINFLALASNRLELVDGQFGLKCKEYGIDNLKELIIRELSNYEIKETNEDTK